MIGAARSGGRRQNPHSAAVLAGQDRGLSASAATRRALTSCSRSRLHGATALPRMPPKWRIFAGPRCIGILIHHAKGASVACFVVGHRPECSLSGHVVQRVVCAASRPSDLFYDVADFVRIGAVGCTVRTIRNDRPSAYVKDFFKIDAEARKQRGGQSVVDRAAGH